MVVSGRMGGARGGSLDGARGVGWRASARHRALRIPATRTAGGPAASGYVLAMRDWFRLLRAAGLITILANLLAATTCAFYAGGQDVGDMWWLVQRIITGGPGPWLILLASACLYLSGMLWNDVVDLERDRHLHPERPLPSGRIGLLPAIVVGVLLTVAAPMAAFAAQTWTGLSLACLVLALSFLYNLGCKGVPGLAPLSMAAVRAAHACFALLLVGDLAQISLVDESGGWRIPPYALLLGGWVLGVTWISELESRQGRRWELIAAGCLLAAILVVAVARVVTAPWLRSLWQGGDAGPILAVASVALTAGLAIAAGTITGVPLLRALRSGSRADTGAAVAAGLGAMILLDAALAAAGQPKMAVFIALLYPVFRAMVQVGRMD